MNLDEQTAIENRLAAARSILQEKQRWMDWVAKLEGVIDIELWRLVGPDLDRKKERVDLTAWGMPAPTAHDNRDAIKILLLDVAKKNIARLEAEYTEL
jgi:hypothetical protein